jgi:hypothetical protein
MADPITLTLTLVVTWDPGETTRNELINQLHGCVSHLADDGWLTDPDSDAEVMEWTHQIDHGDMIYDPGARP